MMKDIGSLFPLYDEDIEIVNPRLQNNLQEEIMLFSLCREALFSVASSLGACEKKVLIPAYTCDTVITPFVEQGWTCIYYPVDIQLRIETHAVEDLYERFRPSLIVVHPYYGKDLNASEIKLLEMLHDTGCKVIVDKTQCIFSSQKLSCVDYYVGSYRKWFAIPDGGYLWPGSSFDEVSSKWGENEDFVSLQRDAMYLRGRYYKTGDEDLKGISRRLNKMAEEMINYNIIPHKISALSRELFHRCDWQQCQDSRFRNYRILLDGLVGVDGCKIFCEDMGEVSSAPLYFMIYVQDRAELQRDLAEEHIYAPVIWPVVIKDVIINDTIKYIYNHILAIPIDQRYDEADMTKIIRLIQKKWG